MVKKDKIKKSILVILVAGIGDLILASRSIRAIRNGYPDADIHLLTNSEAVPVAKNYLYIDYVWSFPIREVRKDKRYFLDIIKLVLELRKILSLRIPVIEDCAQSVGSRYKGGYTGGFGVFSIFSFYATKMLATGEGGMILSDDDRLAGIARDLRDYDEKDSYSVRYN